MTTVGIMDSMISIAIFATAVGTTTATSIVIRIADGRTAVFVVIPAAIIVVLIVLDDIGAGTISTALIGSTEAIIVISLQVGFTPLREAGIGLLTVKWKSVC